MTARRRDRATAAWRTEAPARRAAAAARVLQWAGRLRRRRAGIRHRSLARASRRRRRGSMSSPIPSSAFRSPPRAAAAPGRSTAARTSSRPGRTIRSAIGRARCSICATTTPATLWWPTALPIRDDAATYVARHGWGYSRFEHAAHGIAAELLQYVPLGDPIKISRLTLHNTSRRTRHISRDGLRRMGAGSVARRLRAVRVDRDRSRHRRDVRAQSMACGIRLARRLPRSGRAADRLDR